MTLHTKPVHIFDGFILSRLFKTIFFYGLLSYNRNLPGVEVLDLRRQNNNSFGISSEFPFLFIRLRLQGLLFFDELDPNRHM